MSHRQAAAQLRALRASKKSRLDAYEVEDHKDIYEEVDEEGYKNVVRGRLERDDFVIDDGGQGYADDGREEWQNEQQQYSSDEGDLPLKGAAAKRKREEEKEKTDKTNHKIMAYFNAGQTAAAPKPKIQNTAEDDAFMANLLGDLDTNTVGARSYARKAIKSEARRKVRVLSPPPSRETPKSKVELIDTPPATSQLDDDAIYDFDDDSQGIALPSSPVVKAVERKAQYIKQEIEDEDMMDVAQAFGDEEAQASTINLKASRPVPKIEKPALPTPASSSPTMAPAPEVDSAAWNRITSKLNVVSSSPATDTVIFGKMSAEDAAEEDGSLKMFWLDYIELNGSLCLFGKVKSKKTGRYVSAFVKVGGIQRNLYFLPRKHRHQQGRETEEPVEMKDVYEEVAGLMSRKQIKEHKMKIVERKYAFELPDVPKETKYLKLLYSYDSAPLPIDCEGETFSRVFGTNTSLFEQFVLYRNIMGPCWLNIEGADFAAVNNASWCKLECAVNKPSGIEPIAGDLEAPRLTLMSLTMRTQLDTKKNKQELLVISARVFENVSLGDSTAPEKLPCQTFTVMRPSGTSYPVGFEAMAKKQKGTFMLEKSEKMLLSKFLAIFERTDPDVLMGFQLQDVDYSVLLNRLKENATPGWHRIGRMKRSEWPKNFKGGSFFAERQLLAGRLMCDLANDMGKSLMMKCQQWSLTEMCQLYLGPEYLRRDLDNEAVLKTWATTREGLLDYVGHCDADTFFVAALALKLQMLPLTKVLTNLAGNSWARTLSGTRAERNEYILLHEFHRNKYICPDKIYGKKKEEEGEKKDKYKGGLVFEPEKGLYDKYIIVMDFNSLYPSIIQEYNICFTTVDRSATAENEHEEKIPAVPVGQTKGILPKLIATLVDRRKAVKGLMKDKKATPDQLALWDTKQMALKLTANSMYGCLGYTQSRFYARPLAMLTTFKGREILQSTKELAEDNQLRVIYGDTDSVMINTNASTIAEALKVGNDFKRAVNGQYGLLEIDIDNTFRRLLLHAKKKYAAINTTVVDGKCVDQLEVKGLDMKRREYCALSKEISQRLLNEILSGDDPEESLEKIHDYLRETSTKMRESEIPVRKYTIYNKLGKNPQDYPNADSMPQVQVALREISRGKTVRINDVMPYIVTNGNDETKGLSAPKRAYSPQDVLKPDSKLAPDIEWYLLKQILPPIERLCAPIAGTDSIRLAECLGLDIKKYNINTSSNAQSTEIVPLEFQIPDAERFKDAVPLTIRCRVCTHSFGFDGLCKSTEVVTPDGILCPKCQEPQTTISLVAQLETQIRAQTSAYYAGWLVCDDSACGIRTRQCSVYGQRCVGPQGRAEGCLGKMTMEYSDKKLYNQLLYFASLWDVDRAKERSMAEKELEGVRERVAVLAKGNRERFEVMKGVVQGGYLRHCGRQWVDMEGLFSFAA